MIPDGYYDAFVIEAWTELQREDSSDLMACFGVDMTLPSGEKEDGVARHFTAGQYADITQGIFKHLGLEWPGDLKDMSKAVGKPVRVRVKTKEVNGEKYTNVYIVTSRPRKPATAEQVEAAIAKIEAKAGASDDDEPLPF